MAVRRDTTTLPHNLILVWYDDLALRRITSLCVLITSLKLNSLQETVLSPLWP